MSDDTLREITANPAASQTKTDEQKIINDILDVVITFIHPAKVIMFGSSPGIFGL